MKTYRSLLLLCLLGLLQGCLIFTASSLVLSGGVAALNDRRHFDVIPVDARIIEDLEAKLREDNAIDQSAHIRVFSYNQQVLLTGTAESDTLRLRAVEIALAADSVRKVHNQIIVRNALSEEQRTWNFKLNARIQGTLISAAGIDATHPQYVVLLDNVYLMGLLTRKEAQAVIEIIHNIEGVKNVVPLFEYVTLLPD